MPINLKVFTTSSLCALGLFAALAFLDASPEAPPPVPATPAAETVALDAYGFQAGAFDIETREIQRNQTFSAILAEFGVSAETVHRLAEASSSVFDLRHLRAGKQLRIYHTGGAAQVAVYQADPVRYVVFDLREGAQVYEGRRPVEIVQREAGGVITSSPYETLTSLGADPSLAIHLSEVFAWQIDFYRLRRGDAFHLIYEEREVAGEPAGIERIVAARFEHAGETYHAIRFGEGERYFDAEGRSLRRAFLKAPLKYSRISSRYTKRRFHPVQKRYKPHLGTDYAAPTGTPIRATGDGVVVAAAYTRGNGRYVKIRHNNTYTTGYLHMSRIAKGIRPGTRVQQGDVIGYVGSTGLATGPHLCYRFWKDGVQIDPLKLDMPSADPIDPTEEPAFVAVRDHFLPRLEEHAGP